MTMNTKNRTIAVFGSAHPHVLQVASLAQQAGFEVVGLYDNDKSRRDENAGQLKVQAFENADALLGLKPSVALVGSVPGDRAAMASQCARAGVNVLVDKPLALNVEALNELKRIVAATGRRVIVYYPYRGHPYLRAARAAIARGDIGELVCVETTGPHCIGVHDRPAWHWERHNNGDLLIDIAAHGFDICHWFVDGQVVDVNARMGNFNAKAHPDFRDFGICTLRFSNGVIAKVEADWLVPSAGGTAETRFGFQGTRGRIDIRLASDTSATIRNDKGVLALSPATGSMDDWTIGLLTALCSGDACDIDQDAVWRASETSLRASAAALAEENRFGNAGDKDQL